MNRPRTSLIALLEARSSQPSASGRFALTSRGGKPTTAGVNAQAGRLPRLGRSSQPITPCPSYTAPQSPSAARSSSPGSQRAWAKATQRDGWSPPGRARVEEFVAAKVDLLVSADLELSGRISTAENAHSVKRTRLGAGSTSVATSAPGLLGRRRSRSDGASKRVDGNQVVEASQARPLP
jgi:hypothetical protein